MAARQRHITTYKGVFFINGKDPATGNTDRIYYIRYYKNRKLVEEKAGRQLRDRMTPAKAHRLRVLRIEGRLDSNEERREKARAERNKMTIARIWEAFYDAKQENKSIRDDRNRWRKYLLKDFGNRMPEDLVTTDADRLRRKLQDLGLAPATVRQGLVLLKRIINFGAKRGLCPPINPGQLYFEMPRINNIKTEDLSSKQLAALLDAIDASPHRTAANVMRMALYTGMRKNEIFKLKWEHVDFERGFILLKEPKSGTDQRIPMNKATRDILENHPRKNSEYVFPGRDNGPTRDLRIPLRRICDNAGLPEDFRPMHGLRHVFASTLASSGQVDMYTLQRLLTHKTPSMVQRYAHLRDDALMRASEVAQDAYRKMTRRAGERR